MRIVLGFFCVLIVCDDAAATPQTHIPAVCGKKGNDCLSVVSYNMAIAPGINRLSRERLPLLAVHAAKALKNDDVVCLQEVWTPEALTQIITALRPTHPHVFFANTRGEGETGIDRCEKEEISDIMACAWRQCGAVRAEDMTICARRKCATPLVRMYIAERVERALFGRQSSCFDCLVASVGESIAQMERVCRGLGASCVYGGSNGVVLLSRHALTRTATIHLPKSGSNGVALLARVKGVEVACTHLSSSEEVPPTHPSFSSWDIERQTQFLLIIDRLVARTKDGAPLLMVGDFNFGPGHDPEILAYGEANWMQAMRRGFHSAVALAEPPLCTFCARNTVSRSTESYQVDHAFFRPSDAMRPVCAEQLFAEPVPMQVGKWTVSTHLSDHIGVRVQFCTR